MRFRAKPVALIAAALMLAGPLAFAADAATVARTWHRPTGQTVSVSFNAQSCGARMVRGEVTGGITIDSTSGHFYFSNNAKFTHWSESSGDLDAVVEFDDFTELSTTGSKTLPVGGNPWIYFEPVDPVAGALLGELTGGTFRCQDALNGTISTEITLSREAWEYLAVSGSQCNNHLNGSSLQFDLGSDSDPLDVNVYLTNNKPKFDKFIADGATSGNVPGVHVAAADGTLTLHFSGDPIVQRKGQKGPGGNPHIWLVTPDGSLTPDELVIGARDDLADPYLGRCSWFR